MTPLTIDCARALRDGGIDAMAALNSALHDAIVLVGTEQQEELKRAFGNVMAELGDQIINPAIHAFPELNPDQATWNAIAKDRAAARLAEM